MKDRGRISDRAVVAAIADPNLDAARARASAFNIGATYPTVEAMLGAERLDALDIATPRETHVPICRLAAQHGLAILCQKPLAPTLEDAETLVADLGARARLMGTAQRLQTRLSPGTLASNAWQDAKDKGADIAENAVDAVRKRPVAATGIVAAIALFLAREPLMELAGKVTSKVKAKAPRKTRKITTKPTEKVA